jgi:hydrogenase maturation protease
VGTRTDSTPSAVADGCAEPVERSAEFQIALDTPVQVFDFSFDSPVGQAVGTIGPAHYGIRGSLKVVTEAVDNGVSKLTIDIENTTALSSNSRDRDAALLQSLLSAHAILTANNGQFLSLLDPPKFLSEAAKNCRNVGNFPVLVGTEGERDMLLCSPIILYDYPQISPESAGDFYDATEMDEMLTLRVMTLTDEEKNQVRHGDAHARMLLERTEQSAREQLPRTHGAIRSLRPAVEK